MPGDGPGRPRKPGDSVKSKQLAVYLTEQEYEAVKRLGGSPWISSLIKKELEKFQQSADIEISNLQYSNLGVESNL